MPDNSCLVFFLKKRNFHSRSIPIFIFKVDKHIRRLDSDLARFEAELKDKTLQSQSSDSDSQKSKVIFLNRTMVCPYITGLNVQIVEKLRCLASCVCFIADM